MGVKKRQDVNDIIRKAIIDVIDYDYIRYTNGTKTMFSLTDYIDIVGSLKSLGYIDREDVDQINYVMEQTIFKVNEE